MSSEDSEKEKEIQRREQEIQDRERALKLREMEAELYQIEKVPLYDTQKHQPPENSLKRWLQKAGNVGKFLGIVILVAVSVKVASWLAVAVVVAAISWVAYKIFFDENEPPK